MKIVFDTETCKKNGWDVDMVLYLISFIADAKITIETFEKARQRRLISFQAPYSRNFPFPDYVSLSKEGEFLAETVIADSNAGSTSEDRFVNLANRLRELFPAGKKPGYAYTWRDSTSIIADRLKKFVLKYGDYSDDEIVEATKRYVNSFNGDYKYMQLLKYFIWKNKVSGGELVEGRLVGEVEKQSQLASYIENKDTDSRLKLEWDVELK